MEKTRIDLDIILPEIPNERDECVSRIINSLERRRGIDKVHVVPQKENKASQLCFHYDPEKISIDKIEYLAKQAGAEITVQYGHLLITVSGIRHQRHARMIESDIKRVKGIVSISVSATGFIQLEYNKQLNSEDDIKNQIEKSGLSINNIEDFHAHDAPQQNNNNRVDEHDHDHTDEQEHQHDQKEKDHAHEGHDQEE